MASHLPLTRSFIAIILGFGLMSCSSDTSDKLDDFSPQVPKFINSSSGKDFVAASETLSIEDQLQLDANSTQSSLRVVSECRRSSESSMFKKTRRVSGRTKLHLWELIPNKLLLDKNNKKVACEFSIKYQNDAGSTHEFILSERSISLENTHPESSIVVKGLSAVPAEAGFIINRQNILEVGIQENFARGNNRLICDDFDIELDKGASALSGVYVKAQGLRPDIKIKLLSYPIQNCRLISVDTNQKLKLSPEHLVVFPQMGARVHTIAVPTPKFKLMEERSNTLLKYEVINLAATESFFAIEVPSKTLPVTLSAPEAKPQYSRGTTTADPVIIHHPAPNTKYDWLKKVEVDEQFDTTIIVRDVQKLRDKAVGGIVYPETISFQFPQPLELVRYVQMEDGKLIEVAREELSTPTEVISYFDR